MKLLHILWQGEIGGAERAVYQLAAQQSKQPGWEVHVAFGRAQGLYVAKFAAAGVKVIDLDLKSARDIMALARLQQTLRGYDVHHFHVAEPLIMLASLMVPGVRRIFTLRSGRRMPSGKKALRFGISRILLKTGFHAFSANSKHGAAIAEELFGLSSGTVPVTYNGIDFSLLIPKCDRTAARQALGLTDDATFLIGCVSILKDGKRIDWLLRAVAALPQSNWRLVIIGDGPIRTELEALSRTLGIAAVTMFIGRQDHVPDWLISLDAFVLPSSDLEGFGNAVVEAMALGVPTIICADGGGLREHIVDGETGWEVDGIAGITRRLQLLMLDRAATRRVGEAGRAAIRRKYTVKNMLAAYDGLYDSVLPASFASVAEK